MPRDPHRDAPILTGGAPLEQATRALLLLHGRGGSAQEMLALARDLHASSPAPDGTGEQVVRTGFAPEAAGRQWYPFSLLEKVERNRPHLNSALSLVKRIVERIGAAGIPAERVALLGFSQGAGVVLEFAARHPRRYGAVIALSGALLGPEGTPREYAGSLDGTPVFLGSGDTDTHLPKRRVDETARVFERLGAAVTKRIYPGMGHVITQEEIEEARRMI